MSPPVGLCGVGQMGLAIASRLANSFEVVAFDPNPKARARAAEMSGVRTVTSIEELAESATIVLSLPVPSISHSTCDLLAGILDHGSLVIETSTVLPSDVKLCAARLATSGIDLIDAAILSGVAQMESGSATLLVGGHDDAIERAAPVLEELGPNIKRFGDLGAGMAAKVVNNGVAHAVMVVLVEGFALAKANDVDLADVADMLASPDGGLIRPLTHRIMERVAKADFDGGMPLEAAGKDSTLALAMAQSSGVPLFATQAAQSVYDIAVAQGLGRFDYSVIATLWEQWCDADLMMPPPAGGDRR